MRSTLLCLALAAVVCGAALAELPKDLDTFKAQIAEKATDPKAAVKLWFDAVYVYLTVDKALGQEMILEMDRYKEWDSRSFLTFRSQMDEKPYILFSYAKEATPENEYKFDPNNYELVFTSEPDPNPFADQEAGAYVKLFVKSNGADLPRPITLMRNKRGEYKFYEFSSIYVGVRPPVKPIIFGESIPESKDPKWVFKYWLQGILLYHAGQKEKGLKQMNALMVEPTTEKFYSFPGMAMFKPKTWYWNSYVKGATPDNGYLVPDIMNFEVDTYFQPGEEPKEDSTRIRMFVKCSGADSARPVQMKRDDKGEWRMFEWSSLCVGMRPPKEPKIFGASVPESVDPVWVARQWLQGINMYLAGDKEKGLAQLNSMMKEPTDEKFWGFHDTMNAGGSHIWRSYAKGTTPANQYKIESIPDMQIETYFQEGEAPTPESTLIRMFVRSSGADSARPLKLEKDDRGEWRIQEFSSLCVGVRPPVDPNANDF